MSPNDFISKFLEASGEAILLLEKTLSLGFMPLGMLIL